MKRLGAKPHRRTKSVPSPSNSSGSQRTWEVVVNFHIVLQNDAGFLVAGTLLPEVHVAREASGIAGEQWIAVPLSKIGPALTKGQMLAFSAIDRRKEAKSA